MTFEELEAIKKVLVEMAVNDELPMDMTQLDIQGVAEKAFTNKFNTKLARYGVKLSTDTQGNPKIRKIDNVEEFMKENNLTIMKCLHSDEQAVGIVRELVIDNYIKTIRQNLMEGDQALLYALLKGQGLTPIGELSERDLIIEAIEGGIF
ncbi:MAG TPA: hypothetical protein VJ951_08030 [Bacteroidales bacterium]|nr:hypothetical protein [Bacteroidales bacterium]